jgi:hypothetical protein
LGDSLSIDHYFLLVRNVPIPICLKEITFCRRAWEKEIIIKNKPGILQDFDTRCPMGDMDTDAHCCPRERGEPPRRVMPGPCMPRTPYPRQQKFDEEEKI